MDSAPTPGFDAPPYHVEAFPTGWACVCNRNGFNCLSSPAKPGAKFTTPEHAKAICNLWNDDLQEASNGNPA